MQLPRNEEKEVTIRQPTTGDIEEITKLFDAPKWMTAVFFDCYLENINIESTLRAH